MRRIGGRRRDRRQPIADEPHEPLADGPGHLSDVRVESARQRAHEHELRRAEEREESAEENEEPEAERHATSTSKWESAGAQRKTRARAR
jgi:hypothetical protein